MKNQIPVITIDGPSGVGKGTITARLAKVLKWHLLDSGALYRVLSLAAEQHAVANDDEAGLAQLAQHLDVHFDLSRCDDREEIRLSGEDVTRQIRTEKQGNAASKISKFQLVRAALLERQRAFVQAPGLIAEGRDMGTVIFPVADLKIYLTASPAERAVRRHKQLQEKGIDVRLADLITEIAERDKRDSERAIAPLKPADDAVIIDTTKLTVDEVVSTVLIEVERSIVKPV